MKATPARAERTADGARPPRPVWPTAAAVAAICLACLASYHNSLGNGFVYDDRYQVVENPWLRRPELLGAAFTGSVWSFRGVRASNYYRPLMHVIYMATYQAFGLSPGGFHLVSLLLHTMVSVLVFFVAARIVRTRWPAASAWGPALAALIFATHPVHAEAVSWVAGVPDLTYSLFFLAALQLHLRATEAPSRRGTLCALSVCCFALALLGKEPALVLPLVLVACDTALFGMRAVRTRTVARYVPHLLVAAGYLGLRVQALGGLAPESSHTELSPFEHALNVFPLFAGYLAKLVWPVDLNAFHVLHPVRSFREWNAVSGVLVSAGFAIALAWSRRRLGPVFVALVLLAAPLLPVLYVPALGQNTFAERYLYLPSAGFVLLAAAWIAGAEAAAHGWLRRAAGALGVVCVAAGGLATTERNRVWESDYTLFEDTVRKSPENDQPHNYFANALLQRGELNRAIEEYEMALRLNPHNARAHCNLGAAYLKQGAVERAVRELRLAVDLDPRLIEARNNLGCAYEELGQTDRAIGEFQAALEIDPHHADAHLNLGRAYLKKGWVDRAIAEYRASIASNPEQPEGELSLGYAYETKGEIDAAIEHYRRAVALDAASAAAHNNLGNAFARKGWFDRAVAEFERASQLDPADAAVRANLLKARERLRASGSK